MEGVRERLGRCEALAGVKDRKALAEFLGIKYETMNTWIKKDKITASGILQITEKIPISKTYLEAGTGDPYLSEDTGLSNYAHEDRVDELVDMYKDLSAEDQRLIYQLVKRSWLTRNITRPTPNDEDMKF